MTVLLVLITFVVFLTIDYFYSLNRAPAAARTAEPVRTTATLQPDIVGGFRTPTVMRYHPGHTWALAEGPQYVRVGMDDLAARFFGKAEKIELPARGQWVRQGQKLCSITRDGATVAMVSPVEGMVVDVNQQAIDAPTAALRDPYGAGWLIAVQAPDEKTSFRNLLSGGLARRWMEDAAAMLRSSIPALNVAGAVAQDGGMMVEDVGQLLPAEEWKRLAGEFFLS